MGLDIFAIEKAARVADYDEKTDLLEEGLDEEQLVRVKVNEAFKSHDHITDGIYRWEGRTAEFGSSYGTYGGFRSDLCLLAHGVFPQIVWNNPDLYEGGDFYELINFSDCEGVIGPTTAGKLLTDFKKHRERYFEQNNEWDCERYDDWIKALDISSNDGLLIFC
jgi:hypothetical protein